jgi:hypothetical protein
VLNNPDTRSTHDITRYEQIGAAGSVVAGSSSCAFVSKGSSNVVREPRRRVQVWMRLGRTLAVESRKNYQAWRISNVGQNLPVSAGALDNLFDRNLCPLES